MFVYRLAAYGRSSCGCGTQGEGGHFVKGLHRGLQSSLNKLSEIIVKAICTLPSIYHSNKLMERFVETFNEFVREHDRWCESYFKRVSEKIDCLEVLIEQVGPKSETDDQCELSEFGEELLFQHADDLKSILNKSKEQFAPLSNSLEKMKYLLENKFHNDLSKFSRPVDLETVENWRNVINELIIEHFACEGRPELVQKLVEEIFEKDGKKLEIALDRGYSSILEAFDERNVVPAIEYLEVNHPNEQDLLFLLHQLRFKQLLKSGTKKEAIEYCRRHLNSKINSISKLFWSIVVNDRESRYPDLFDESTWLHARKELAQVIFKQKDVLRNILEAGLEIMPRIVEVLPVLRANDVLAIRELPLRNNFTNPGHTLINCPVLKKQCTRDNPPLRIKCGHIVSRAGFESVAGTEDNGGGVFRCSFCNVESSFIDTRFIHLS